MQRFGCTELVGFLFKPDGGVWNHYLVYCNGLSFLERSLKRLFLFSRFFWIFSHTKQNIVEQSLVPIDHEVIKRQARWFRHQKSFILRSLVPFKDGKVSKTIGLLGITVFYYDIDIIIFWFAITRFLMLRSHMLLPIRRAYWLQLGRKFISRGGVALTDGMIL